MQLCFLNYVISILISEIGISIWINYFGGWESKQPCLQNSRGSWDSRGWIGVKKWSSPSSFILREVKLENVLGSYHVPGSVLKALHTLSDFCPQNKPFRSILQIRKEAHKYGVSTWMSHDQHVIKKRLKFLLCDSPSVPFLASFPGLKEVTGVLFFTSHWGLSLCFVSTLHYQFIHSLSVFAESLLWVAAQIQCPYFHHLFFIRENRGLQAWIRSLETPTLPTAIGGSPSDL